MSITRKETPFFLGLTDDVGVSKSRVKATNGSPDLIDYSSVKKYFKFFFFSKNVFHPCFILIGSRDFLS